MLDLGLEDWNWDVSLRWGYEQLEFLQRPVDAKAGNEEVAWGKTLFLLLSRLSYGGLSDLIPGEKASKFWVTPKFRISMEPHTGKLDGDGTLSKLISNHTRGLRNQVSLLDTEAKDRARQRAANRVSGEEGRDGEGREGGVEGMTPAPSQLPSPREVGTWGAERATALSSPSLDLSGYRARMAVLDSAKCHLQATELFYPFGLVLDNTGDLDCTRCPAIPGILLRHGRCWDCACPCYPNYQRYSGIPEPFPRTVVDVYAATHGMPVSVALADLQEKLGVDVDRPLSKLSMSERARIIQLAVTERFPVLQWQDCMRIEFPSEDGLHTHGTVAVHRQPDGRKLYVPWAPADHSSGGALMWFPVPFRRPFPLLNLDALHMQPDAPVLLTDCIEAAAFITPPSGQDKLGRSEPPGVAASWYGGRQAIPLVNWKTVRGRDVLYWVLPHSQIPLKEHLETAVRACFELRALPGTKLSFAVAQSLSPFTKARRMSVEEFLEHASDAGLGSVIEQLQARSRSSERRALGRGDRRTVQLSRPLVHPEILRARQVNMLCAEKGLGKTAFAMSLAFCAATGTALFKPWGSKGLERTKVLYWDGEMADGTLATRVDANRRHLEQLGVEDDLFFEYYKRVNVYSEEGRRAIEMVISDVNRRTPRDIPVGLLVIDNITAMTGGRDDQAGWDEFFSWARELNKKEMTVLVIKHGLNSDDTRGTQATRLNCDNNMYLEKQEPTGDEASENDDSGDEASENDDSGNEASENDDSGNEASENDEIGDELDVLRLRFVPKNMRSVKFNETNLPLDLLFRKNDASWSLMGADAHVRKVLMKQVRDGLSDVEMGEFWGLSADQMKRLRGKHKVRKYEGKTKKESKG